MGEASANLLVHPYSDYRDNDFNPSSAFAGENTPGFTLYAIVSGVPKIKNIQTGERYGVSLTLSFGDPNGGARIGRKFNYGPDEFEIPADGEIVAIVNIGYLGNNAFGLLNGFNAHIPSGLGGSTVAAYWNPGETGKSPLTIPVYVITPGLHNPSGGTPLTEPPKGMKLKDPGRYVSSDIRDVIFEFDYFNTSGENPASFALRAETRTGSFIGVSYTHPTWVNGQTHYELTADVITNWSSAADPARFFVYPERGADTGPGSNIVTMSNGTNPTYVGLTSSHIIQLSSVSGPALQQMTLPAYVGNLSGLYRLTENQRHDVVYNREPFYDEDSLTNKVKIPNPRYRTAFLP